MTDIIKDLLALDDAGLTKKLGFADKVAAFKLDLGRADALAGDARTSIQADLTRMFTPESYAVGDLGWKIDRQLKKDAKSDTMLGACNVCDCD